MLVDQFGYPMDVRLINAASRDTRSRPYIPTRNEDIRHAVNWNDLKQIQSISRRLWSNNGIIKGATMQKAMHAIGRAWNPVFAGEDKKWGDLATDWLLNEWYILCNVRGENFDFKTSLYLESISIDRDGDEGTLLTETVNGYPQIQVIPAHRIGMRGFDLGKVKTGDFAGYDISHGVITNTEGRPVAYRILGDRPEDDKDVPERDCMLSFDPEWADQLRGFPIFSHALNDLRDADQSQYWEQLNQLISSSRTLIEHNESGTADNNEPGEVLGNNGADGNPQTFTAQKIEGGTIQYFKAGTGGKLEQFVNMRPGADWDSFQDRLARKALLGIGWPYSLCWKPDGQNGTQERAEIEKARTSILDRQELLRPRARRKVGYAISKAIKLGILPEYPGKDRGGFLKWDFTMPPKFSIDNGRDGQTRREDYKLGIKNLDTILAEQGESMEQHLRQRAHEVALRKKIQAEVAASEGVEINDYDMCLFNPNQIPVGVADTNAVE